MASYRELVSALRDLGLTPRSRLIVHIAPSSLEAVAGGTESVLGAILASSETLIMPAFTYRTMVVPETGPPENGVTYGSDVERTRTADFFHPEMPSDPVMGEAVEILRHKPESSRSSHPILSFAGMNADECLATQTLDQPLAPIAWLAEGDGDVLLVGADHTANVSLHYAEQLAGRKQFVRWALTPDGVATCPDFPGCSDGFAAIGRHLQGVARLALLGRTLIQMIPLRDLIHVAVAWMRQDPRALLCDRLGCERCRDVRASVRVER